MVRGGEDKFRGGAAVSERSLERGGHGEGTGAEEPYDKLKRALRAEIDETAWSSLYSTVSRPFAKPASGKIAVKVINHYGDEVLKVFEVY